MIYKNHNVVVEKLSLRTIFSRCSLPSSFTSIYYGKVELPILDSKLPRHPAVFAQILT